MANGRRERVSAHDAIWLQDSAVNPMIINSVCTLDRADTDVIRALWSERVLSGPNRERFARLARRIVHASAGPYWEDVPAFDAGRHVYEVTGASIRGKADLERYVGSIAAEPLPAERPPWEVRVIPDCGDGASAMIVRFHHVLGDGMGLLPVLYALLDEDGGEAQAGEAGRIARPGPVVRQRPGVFARALAGPLSMPWIVLRRALAAADSNALRVPELSGRKRVAWSEPLELAQWQDARRALGATVNDVLTAAVGGAIRRVLEEQGELPGGVVRASVPVSVRPPGEPPRLENRFATIVLPVPVVPGAIGARVHEARRIMRRVKGSLEPLAMHLAVSAALGVLPDALSRRLVDHIANRCTLVLTNVPGPGGTLRMAGRRVREMVFWVPQRAEIGLGVSLFSHGGRLVVGVMSDAAVLEEPSRIITGVEEELRVLAESGQS